MYINLLQKSLQSKGIIENVDMKIVRRIATLYPVYIMMIICLTLVLLGVIDNLSLFSRIFMLTSLYPLSIVITLCAHFYGKLGRILLEAANAGMKNKYSDKSGYEKWIKIAQSAIFLRYYAIIVGIPAVALIVAAVWLDGYTNPDFFFLYAFILVGFGLYIPSMAFILQFTDLRCCKFRLETLSGSAKKISTKISQKGTKHKDSSYDGKNTSEETKHKQMNVSI
eukprot:CAMPEP_0184031174 /NCGR_PEP_ID=MMETSP0955-20130417/2050_1 /TAXON_ID=627963 /ORGANISM="Aplanochytrium sp, Strain PBS07" /LENGTH=223 /DNA_ID=CAMNT_0026316841 /DNA_START=380 /DNA_END=1051 /DNA_ORIENTATION=-